MTCNIVIAYYCDHNFLKLLDTFKERFSYPYNTIIYNKSETEILLENDSIQKKVENIGREGETYLNHIINNYDNLSDYTIFIQDDTHNHIPNYNTFIAFCNDIIKNKQKFALYPSSWRVGGSPVKRKIINGVCNLHTFPSSDSIKHYCNNNDIYLPKEYTTETCAFFICHRDSIVNHPKTFYIKLRNWLLGNDKNGFVLEHMWKLILSEHPITST